MAAIVPAWAWAEDLAIPLQLQADLSVKVVEYVQDPLAQEADVLRIGILVKTRRPESARAADELKAAFDRSAAVGGRGHAQALMQWIDPESLARDCQRRHLAIVYLTPGFEADVAAIARALEGVRVITIAAVDSYVRDGALLGFELVSGHPKMVFNLGQAKKQGVILRSAVMKLMRIVG